MKRRSVTAGLMNRSDRSPFWVTRPLRIALESYVILPIKLVFPSAVQWDKIAFLGKARKWKAYL